MENLYTISRVLNNNVILARNLKNDAEEILVGKGIGFGKRAGQEADLDKVDIDKTFLAYDKKILYMCTNIIETAEKKLGELNPKLYIVLTDHISFAIERLQKGMEIHNPFLDEIKCLYEEEFRIGLEAKEYIARTMGIDIVDDEVGFIALHLNAARHHVDVKESVKNTRMIKELAGIIEDSLGIKLENDFTYARLVHHLRSTIERVDQGKSIINPILDSLMKELKDSVDVANKLKNKIEKELDKPVSDDELAFMAIHIERIRRR